MIAYSNFDDLPLGHYRLILADNPWRFKTYTPESATMTGTRHAEKHYPTMTIEALKALPVKQIAAKDCYLMMWSTWPFLVHSLDCMKSWGFTYSSSFKVWLKLKRSFSQTRAFIATEDPISDLHTGTGYTTRKNTEFILLGRRGAPKRLVKNEHEVMIAAVREHSRKPDQTIAACERYAVGPYLELFARTERPGWDAFGDQIERFIAPPPPAIIMPEPEPIQRTLFMPEDADAS